jgi:hypothetical protein
LSDIRGITFDADVPVPTLAAPQKLSVVTHEHATPLVGFQQDGDIWVERSSGAVRTYVWFDGERRLLAETVLP